MTMIKLVHFAISPAKVVDNDIVLNCCSLEDVGHPAFSHKGDDVEDYCLTKAVPIGQRFLYKVEIHNSINGYMADCGVGVLKKSKKSVILERQIALMQIYDSGPVPARSPEDFMWIEHKDPLCITTFYPETLSEATLLPNTLWFSGGLALLEEGGILLWDEDDLSPAKPEKILKFLSKSSAQLSVGSLQVKPVKKRPTRSKKGTIIFNELTGQFEGYDGKKWRNLNWED